MAAAMCQEERPHLFPPQRGIQGRPDSLVPAEGPRGLAGELLPNRIGQRLDQLHQEVLQFAIGCGHSPL